MSPQVSIIVPMWNSAATIESALASLSAQSMHDWEAIVVDDGSTDAGPAIANRIAGIDPRVRMVSQANRGLSAARNAGLEHAQGKYIHFLDADDTIPHGAIEALVAHAQNSGGAAFGAFAWIEPRSSVTPYEVEISCRSAGLHELLERNRFPVHAQLIERALIGEERFDESLRSAEDWDLWLRLAARGVRWRGLDQVVAHYHLTPGSMSRDSARMLDAMALVARSAFARARSEERSDCDASRERERSVRLRLAIETATGSILQDDSAGADIAAALLASANPGRGEVQAQSLAVAAYWALPQAARVTPLAWSACDARWLRGLERFWTRCAGEGWIDRGAQPAARNHLAELLVEPSAIACELVERARGARSIELIGFGRNGRRIAGHLSDQRIPFALRDDTISEGWVEIAGARAPARAIDGAYAQGAVAIVSPEVDAMLLPRLPRHVTAITWAGVRRELSGRLRERLLGAWPASMDLEAAA